jgi:hypothetical protein
MTPNARKQSPRDMELASVIERRLLQTLPGNL